MTQNDIHKYDAWLARQVERQESTLTRPTERQAIESHDLDCPVGRKPAKHQGHADGKAWHRRTGVLDYNNPQVREMIAQRLAKAERGKAQTKTARRKANKGRKRRAAK